MSGSLIQLLVLAGIALFLVFKLRDVLGTRGGFEPEDRPAPAQPIRPVPAPDAQPEPDDIDDHAEPGSPTATALRAMQAVEPGFAVTPFLNGARQAYEMILMAFERGDLSDVRAFLAPAVAEALDSVIADRQSRGLTTEAQFLGSRDTALQAASFDPQTGLAELTVRFVGELIVATRDASGEVVEGDPKAARKQRDIWTFARHMGQDDPNWQLVATG